MTDDLAHFSIVIPTYNRRVQLRNCLAALAELDYPTSRYEVIVVDDGGDEPLDEVVDAFRDGMSICLLRQANAGPGAARNAGAAAASGEYLALTDDDCCPQPGWLRAFAARFAASPNALLGGHTVNGLPDNIYSTATQTLQEWLYDYWESRRSPQRFFASNNLCLPRRLFLDLGGFDAINLPYAGGEDRELCGRWMAAGGELIYVREALIRHFHALDAGRFWRQHFRYGQGAYRMQQARRQQGLPPLPRDVGWVLASVFRYPWTESGVTRGLAMASLMLETHLANLAGYSFERMYARR